MNWHEYFTYDGATGNLIHKERPCSMFKACNYARTWNTQNAFKTAGYVQDDGYRVVRLLGKTYKAHRIIWEMNNGAIPEGIDIDHRDRNKANNRIANLRKATASQNLFNSPKRTRNTSGVKGVSLNRNKWQARIMVNGVDIRLGRFVSKGMAAVAYAKAAIRYHGEFARVV